MTKQFKKDMKVMLDYLWRDERNHYLCNRSRDHIYIILRRLAKAVGHNPDVAK